MEPNKLTKNQTQIIHQTKRTPNMKMNRNKRKKHTRHLVYMHLESQAITNLSSYNLTESEQKLLTKGLSYIPSFNTYKHKLQKYTNEFIRQLHLTHYFKDSKKPTPQFHTKSDWNPPAPLNPHINTFTNKLTDIIKTTLLHDPTNLHKQHNTEHRTIQNLRNNKNITIKRADKGGSIVIMNTNDYINTALSHLQQTTIYTQQDIDNTNTVADNLNSLILQLSHTGHLTKEIAKYIQPKSPPRTPFFYFLPKIHKQNNPPRPIISGCDSPTDRLSKYLTSILNPIAQAQPSYLKDTKHLLQIIQNHPPLPSNTFLVTADVSSLYTNIPHEEGMDIILNSLNTHRHILPKNTPNNAIIRNFLHFILKDNYFDFLNKHYLQIQGTAMGTKMAPPYANIFMAHIEKQITQPFNTHILLWKRFIDDIFFIWQGTLQSLKQFFLHANAHHKTIKFTFEHSNSSINFLDTIIYIDKKRTLQTTIYRKPTDKNLILHFSSHHPFHIKRNIIYSQIIRYKRIISTKYHLRKELTTLKNIFTARGYPGRLIIQQIQKAKHIPRTQLLKDTTKIKTKKTIFKIPFHPKTNNFLKRQIRHTWNSLLKNTSLKTLWPSPPTFIECTNKNLKDLLIRTKQQNPTTTNTQHVELHKS